MIGNRKDYKKQNNIQNRDMEFFFNFSKLYIDSRGTLN